jgi:(p)ppGpp synthase/HD superfamily hydrolase
MDPEDQKRLVAATECAYAWHAKQRRKQSEIPYVSHLLQVKGLVLEHGGNADQAIAGLLHDCLEDAPSAEERALREEAIAARFGEDVLAMVHDCTDTGPDESLEEKRPWQERKRRYIEQLGTASPASLLVVACDKRHNLQALVWDVRTDGPSVFARFTGTPDQQIWYFESILAAIRASIPERLRLEIEDLLATLKRLVADLGTASR